MSGCPSREELQHLLAEELSEVRQQAIEAHVEACAACQETLTRLSDEGKPVDRVFRALPTAPLADCDVEFMRYLKENPPRGGETPADVGGEAGPAPIVFPGPPGEKGPLGHLDSFAIRKELGAGRFGVVYQAYDELDRLVAIKILKPEFAASAKERARFEHEARTAASVEHDHIVTIHQVGHAPGFPLPYLVMEYVDGEALSEQLSRQGVIEVPEAARIVQQVAMALAAAHARALVHRDIKPSNILLDKNSGRAKLTDFGLARLMEVQAASTVQSERIVGTPPYMSPEQILAPGSADARSDVYSLGVVLYELLTGERPFRGVTHLLLHQVQHEEPRPPRKLNDAIPRDLETITLKCLAKEPGRRYQTALALAEDLKCFLEGSPIQGRPVSAWERLARQVKRRPAAVALIGVTGAGLILLTAGGFRYTMQQQDLQAADRLRRFAETSWKEADDLRIQAETERVRANEQKSLAVQYTYAAQMKSAHQSWQSGNLRSMVDVLSPYAERPERRELRDFVWYYLWALCHSERVTLRGHKQDVYGVTFSQDGTLLATAGRDATVKLWEAVTGRERATFRGHTDEVNWVAFSPDGKTMASASDDHTVRLWNASSGQEAKCLGGHTSKVRCCEFSPDGQLLASAGDDRLTLLWDPVTGEKLVELQGHRGVIESLAFSPDSKTLASASRDHSVMLWDMASRRLRACWRKHTGHVQAVAFSPDSRVLATASGDKTVRLWDAVTGDPGLILWHTDVVQSVCFSPDGKTLASCSDDRTVRLWDVASGQLRNILAGHMDRVWCVRFSPDGRTLATAGQDATVKLWDPVVSQERQSLPEDGSSIRSFAFTPDSRLAVGRADGTVRLWDLATKRIIRPDLHVQVGGSVSSLGFSPDAQMLAAGTSRGLLSLWDLAAGQTPHLLKENRLGAVDLALFTDKGTLATQRRGEAMQFWDVAAGRARAQLPVPPNTFIIFDLETRQPRSAPCPLAFSSAGQTLATWVWGDTFTIWDLTTGQQRGPRCRHHGLGCITFSPDGQIIATGGLDGVKLWDARSGQERPSLLGNQRFLVSLAFSPDGKILATGSQDQKVKLWHVATEQELMTLEGHAGAAQALAFAPDGQMLVSAGETRQGHEIYFWPAQRSNRTGEN